ncbi:hypothetical protein [Pseudolactococcus reticulitermitis]|uniref:Uncharacterized protein n=1 Tax=Pseudolactococcus reticulitermitis TaxID=2025039 RepID=A0A224XAH0_9LACT|nr:hypothetical protein [Lactococcus reticulitermitis]GAX48260.1 hypothetical protein RsY01_1875 [Lactococcus reticulitermitis]
MKKVIMLLLSLVLITTFTINIHAEEATNSKNTISPPKYSVQITNTETGEQKQIFVNKNDVKVTKNEVTPIEGMIQGYSASIYNNDKVYTEYLEIELGKELAESFGLKVTNESGSATKDSDVRVTAGLTYSTNASNNTVKIHNAFGSTVNKGYYYVQKRAFYWRNPGSGNFSHLLPSSASWNYSVSDSWGTYSSSLQPYAITEATVRVSGMDGERVISVTYYLSA